jgi:hypothetical protein
MELQQTGKLLVQFDPKIIYLSEGADLGRASSRDKTRINDPDTGYLKFPTGRTRHMQVASHQFKPI